MTSAVTFNFRSRALSLRDFLISHSDWCFNRSDRSISSDTSGNLRGLGSDISVHVDRWGHFCWLSSLPYQGPSGADRFTPGGAGLGPDVNLIHLGREFILQ